MDQIVQLLQEAAKLSREYDRQHGWGKPLADESQLTRDIQDVLDRARYALKERAQ